MNSEPEQEHLFPLSFPPWVPTRRAPEVVLKVRSHVCFVPRRLMVSPIGAGRYDVRFSMDVDGWAVPKVLDGVGMDWAPAELWCSPCSSPNVELGGITPDEVLCLHVRWTPPPLLHWFRRLLLWLRFWRKSRRQSGPIFHSMLLGHVVR